MLARDTLSAVAHSYRNKPASLAIAAVRKPNTRRCGDRNLTPRATVFDAVVDEILKNLGELVTVAQHLRQSGRQVETNAHAALGGVQLERVGEVTQQRV